MALRIYSGVFSLPLPLTFVTSRNRFKAILSLCNIGMIFCSVYVVSGAP